MESVQNNTKINHYPVIIFQHYKYEIDLQTYSLIIFHKIWSGLKAPAEPSCRVPTHIVYFFKFILVEDFS